MTLTDLCQECKNWFDIEKHFDTFSIEDGSIDLDFLDRGQYYRIIGSVFNDGVYKYGYDTLKDETFDGAIWALAIPKSFIELCDKITEFEVTNKKLLNSPYQSESFGGYSYSKPSGFSFKDVFKSDLNRWRKV
jgi:hypothetical protein